MASAYRVIRERGCVSLGLFVNEAIKEGWEPQGGVCCDDKGNFYQAMIRA